MPDVLGCQIIVLGSFNPPMFTPEWLNKNGLLGDSDTEEALGCESLIVTKDIARYETEWFALQIIQKQLALTSKGPVTPLIQELALGIFTLADQTPVSAVGLNFIGDYKIATTADYHKIGDVLAPKDLWLSFYPEGENQSVGLTNLLIEIDPFGRGKDRINGRIRRISVAIAENLVNGVRFTFNDHHPIELEKKSKTTQASVATNILSQHWQESMNESLKLFAHIINGILEKKS